MTERVEKCLQSYFLRRSLKNCKRLLWTGKQIPSTAFIGLKSPFIYWIFHAENREKIENFIENFQEKAFSLNIEKTLIIHLFANYFQHTSASFSLNFSQDFHDIFREKMKVHEFRGENDRFQRDNVEFRRFSEEFRRNDGEFRRYNARFDRGDDEFRESDDEFRRNRNEFWREMRDLLSESEIFGDEPLEWREDTPFAPIFQQINHSKTRIFYAFRLVDSSRFSIDSLRLFVKWKMSNESFKRLGEP